MKSKIIKHFRATLLCCLYYIVVVTGDSSLQIWRNVDGSLMEVPSKLEVPSGANLTLICKLENIKSKGLVNGYVTWFIPPKIHSELKLTALKSSSDLVFSNMNANDEGLYVCGSLKYKISKILHLIVKQDKTAEPNHLNFARLVKREIIPGYGPLDYSNYTYTPDLRDLTELNKNMDKMREDLMKQLGDYDRNNYGSYNNYNNDISYDNVHNKGHPNSHSFPFKPVGVVFGVLFIVFIMFLLIRLCGFIKHNSSINRHNRQQNIQNSGITAPRINRCGHPSCTRNYLLNPAGACRFHTNTEPTAPILFDAMDIVRPPPLTTRNPTTQLDLPDLPPTYSSSTHNSTHNLNDGTNELTKKNLDVADGNNFSLPPSYDEAIGNKNDRHNTPSHSRNGNQDSEQNHRRDDGNVHHSTSDGFSRNHNSGGGDGGHSRASGGDY